MASNNLYKAIAATDQENTLGGYKNVVLWAPVDTFASVAVPTPTPAALGDKYTISGDHTFNTSEGWISWLCKLNAVQITGATIGDDGANLVLWTAKFTLIGDGASTQEQVLGQLNSANIFLFKDSNCLAGAPYVQIGDECNSPLVKPAFDSKTTSTTAPGLKEYPFEVTGTAKYFYPGTITLKPTGGG